MKTSLTNEAIRGDVRSQTLIMALHGHLLSSVLNVELKCVIGYGVRSQMQRWGTYFMRWIKEGDRFELVLEE